MTLDWNYTESKKPVEGQKVSITPIRLGRANDK